MAISDMLNRRVRARPADEDDIYSEQSDAAEEVSQDEGEEEGDSDAESQSEEGSEQSNAPEDDNSDGSNSAAEDEESSEDENDDIKTSLSNISFGALAKAQASMGPKKRKEKSSKEEASPLDDIRARILEAREQKRLAAEKTESKDKKDKKDKKAARANKHAPMEQSSKRAVSRRLVVVEPPSHAKARDPRFDAAVMGYSGKGKNPELADKAYAFLDDYRLSELKEMKAEMARTKDPRQKEALKKQILSASDRMKSMENRKRERNVQMEHKQKEKQMLREGKKSTPYFLKNSDLKKQVMQKKYEEMGSRDRARALERRRKKISSKEKKEMPWERRGG
ncbi:rRNA biogenesis protein rrp36 [Penicillium atrosanguineum]|nr:rRNA biogenesis protein rrp36 [Penicillium atrosanguineum]